MATTALKVTNLEDAGLRGLTSRLLNGSALVRPVTPSPFEKFGVLAVGPIKAQPRESEETRFSATSARMRIGEFVEGSFRPNMLQDLLAYLAERFLKLESRTFADGSTVNYLVDLVTKQSVLAANVDARLSRNGVARLFGRTLDAEAQARRRRLEMTPEMVDALSLRSANANRFRNDPREIPFSDWEDISFSAHSVFQGREITAQGNETWVGFEVAKASADAEENLALMRRMAAKGYKIILPARTADEARAGQLVAGMPILLREGAVRTTLVNPAFTTENFVKAFGQSAFEHYEALAKRSATGATPKGKVVKMAEFKRMRREEGPAVAAVERVAQPASKEGRFTVRHELGETGKEALTVIDATSGAQIPLGDTDLVAGRYMKEDTFGLASGFLVIKPDGGYVHEDVYGRHHNPFGPAIVPVAGSGERLGFALDGEFLTARDFKARNDTGSARALLRREDEERTKVVEEAAPAAVGPRLAR